MNVLVTGGAGFIGSHLVDLLVSLGYQVTVLDNLSTGKRNNLPKGCELVMGDIRSREDVDRCVRDKKLVFHLAAYTSLAGSIEAPNNCFDININGTRQVLESAIGAGVKKVVFASSSAIYADIPDGKLTEETPADLQNPYAQSKLEGEDLLRWHNQHHGLAYAAMRFFNVYGPRQDSESDYAAVIPAFISSCLASRPLTICGDGLQTRDFVYVTDVAQANLQAALTNLSGEFNVGTSYPVSVVDLALNILSLRGSTVGYHHERSRPSDVRASTADISKISQKIGWEPRWSLMDGLKNTIDWFESQQRVIAP